MLFLVTGATGFLGSNITRALIARGHQVRALVRANSAAAQSVPPEVEITVGDLLDTDALSEFFNVENPTELIVLHCASYVSLNPEWDSRVYETNVTGTQNIVDQCLKHNVKKLVYVSSTGAIPELPHGQKIAEVDHLDPERVIGCYSQTKAMATQLVLDAVATTGLDASVVYPSGIFGPNDYGYSFVPTFIIDYTRGKMPIGVGGSFNAVDVRDLAEGIIECAFRGQRGQGYIISNMMVPIPELFEAVRKHAGGPKVKLILPIALVKVIARIAEAISKVSKKPTILTTFTVYNLARNNDFDNTKALQELQINLRPFEETVKDTADWLRSEGKIQAFMP